MNFVDLQQEAKKIKRLELRAEEANYLELVIAKNELGAMENALGQYFGLPIKPIDQQPSHEADALSGPHGGIQSNQIMYCLKSSEGVVLAFLWPWGSGQAITVKIIRE